jgi:hypothetical protein
VSSLLERRVEEYANGLRCHGCHQEITSIGCPCSRARAYQSHTEEVADWYDGLSAEVKKSLRGFDPMAAVRSTLTRERRRAGFRDMPTEPVETHHGGSFGGATVSQDERLGLYREHEIASKWVKPTEKRTAKADLEPI